jgi:diketogulonate reductase-like aldo/keto reductase
MYGSSQDVIGEGLQKLRAQPAGADAGKVFAADKVWTSSDGAAQIEQSRQFWRVPRFDLLQVHNLLAWEKQLPLLQAMKAAGTLRHVGITTSEGRRHRELAQIMRSQRIDFVQLSYNLLDREVEETLLPLARERGIAVLVNRPFRQGDLLRQLQRHPLPGWAREIGCTAWSQVALKFVVSHPAVSCAIPATSSALHVRENMAAAHGAMPDDALRKRMAADVGKL